jgi:hypothetical protein
MSLEEMLLRGELSREPASGGEIRRLIDAAIRRLEDAANTSIHPETRLEQAYHAILNCALAALRIENLRAVNGPGKHRFVLESLANTLGTPPDLISYFQQMRDLRHRDIYGGLHPRLRARSRGSRDRSFQASPTSPCVAGSKNRRILMELIEASRLMGRYRHDLFPRRTSKDKTCPRNISQRFREKMIDIHVKNRDHVWQIVLGSRWAGNDSQVI